jgi:hypothetical protein
MRNLFAWTIAVFMMSAVITLAAAGTPGVNPQRLESYVGKYPSDLFRGVPSLKPRLRTLLGRNYALFMERLQTEMPIENDAGALVARGCMAHSCGVEEAVLVINLADGKLHCAILSEKFGGKFKVFSEDSAHIPGALTRAIKR